MTNNDEVIGRTIVVIAEVNEEKILARIKVLVRTVEGDPDSIGVLSMAERCAVALVLDRVDARQADSLLPRGYTALDAVDRIGIEWLDAAIRVQRDGWLPRS